MEKFYVAPSYEGCDFFGKPFENPLKGGKMYVKVYIPCKRCGGSGSYSYCSHYGTICLRCHGAGVEMATIRAYTEKEYNAMIKAKERAAAKKEAEKQAKINTLMAEAETNKLECANKLGFNDNLITYMVVGDNVYQIKDELKERGAKYNPIIGWHVPVPIYLPKGYSFCEISFDEVYDFKPLAKNAEMKIDAKQIVEEKLAEMLGEGASEFYPEDEGTRIRGIEAIVGKIIGFSGTYGYTYIYNFIADNFHFVWMTSSHQSLEEGDAVVLAGTIKKFDTYKGVHITYLTRCKIINI